MNTFRLDESTRREAWSELPDRAGLLRVAHAQSDRESHKREHDPDGDDEEIIQERFLRGAGRADTIIATHSYSRQANRRGLESRVPFDKVSLSH